MFHVASDPISCNRKKKIRLFFNQNRKFTRIKVVFMQNLTKGCKIGKSI